MLKLIGLVILIGSSATIAGDTKSTILADTLLTQTSETRACDEPETPLGYRSRCGIYRGKLRKFQKAWDEAVGQLKIPDVLTAKTDWQTVPGRWLYFRDYLLNEQWFRVIYVKTRDQGKAGLVTIHYDRDPKLDPAFREAPVEGTTNPKIIYKTLPVYPKKAFVKRIRGRVVVRAMVRKDGTVGEPIIAEVLPPGFGFEDAAVEALIQQRYEPSMLDGEAIDVLFTTWIEFGLNPTYSRD